MNAPAGSMRNPYPGLRPFRPDEEHLFFGREKQVDRMIGKLAAQRFLAVVGTSGSGKSSLVNCGLRPALHRGYMAGAGSNWRVAQFRPGSDPIAALARSLAAPGVLYDQPLEGAVSEVTLVETTLQLSSLGLVTVVEQADLPAGTQLLVVADQFEELFRGAGEAGHGGASAQAAELVELLLAAAAQTAVPVHVVLTMRSDFLGDCAQFQGLPEAINESQYLVPRLTREQIRAAVTGPAGVQGAALSRVLVMRLLNDVGDNPDQLSILQHALNRTWADWEVQNAGQGDLELVNYENTGTMAGALNRHANKAYGELPEGESRLLCQRVFKALTDTSSDARGVRRMTRLSDLCAITGANAGQLEAVFSVFRKGSRSFLMPPEGEALRDDSDIDISHESLMRLWKELKQWAADEAQSARTFKDLREQALRKGSLYRDPELAVALEWRARTAPTEAWARLHGGGFEEAMRFLDDSQATQQVQQREAEIERRWLSGWQFLPVALVALPFVWAQIVLARFEEEGSVAASLLEFFRLPETWVGFASHLIAGIPAMLAFMALSPFVKRRFRIRALAELARHGRASGARPDRARQGWLETAKRAHFVRRAAAQLVDWFLVVPMAISATLIADLGLGLKPTENENWLTATLLILSLMLWLYHMLLWKSGWQGTLGQRLLRLHVVDLRGQPIGFWRGSARFFMRFLSYYSLGIGFLMQPFTAQRQTLHDRVCGTLVLHLPRVKKG